MSIVQVISGLVVNIFRGCPLGGRVPEGGDGTARVAGTSIELHPCLSLYAVAARTLTTRLERRINHNCYIDIITSPLHNHNTIIDITTTVIMADAAEDCKIKWLLGPLLGTLAYPMEL